LDVTSPIARFEEPGDTPPPELRFRRKYGLRAELADLWSRRALVRALAERDLRAQYKQAAFGVVWAIATPLLLMVVFTIVFKQVAKVDTGEVPYALFAYLGLIPWTFFSASASSGASSLISNKALLNKVKCPREVFPLARMGVAAVNLLISVGVLALLFLIYQFPPAATTPLIVVPALIELAFTAGIALLLAACTVYVRDINHALPIVLQLALFATPVGYTLASLPPDLRQVIEIVNPMAPIIESYRDVVLYGRGLDWVQLTPAIIISSAVLLIGYQVFKRLETGIADIA
jgi:ABC-2 type transport system permease protein/lipopolysaccharide transport system permease protein